MGTLTRQIQDQIGDEATLDESIGYKHMYFQTKLPQRESAYPRIARAAKKLDLPVSQN